MRLSRIPWILIRHPGRKLLTGDNETPPRRPTRSWQLILAVTLNPERDWLSTRRPRLFATFVGESMSESSCTVFDLPPFGTSRHEDGEFLVSGGNATG
jgi:hypothetical protein